MSALAAYLFAWLQDAAFYRDMSRAAADLAQETDDNDCGTWLDVGCGPGDLTRIAAAQGYASRGIDCDPAMIEMARRLGAARGSPAQFAVSDCAAESLRTERYDVVSASSLLIVMPNPAAVLQQLVALTKPNGKVLIIEASGAMTRRHAFGKIVLGDLGSRAYMLGVWAMFRAGRVLKDGVFHQTGLSVTHHLLLAGLARASIVRRATDEAPEVAA
ncbi:MAG: class I SAM-dependent methyltransferase [Methylovirgula sp.]